VRFAVLTTVRGTMLFWVMMPMFRRNIPSSSSVLNVGIFQRIYTASHPRKNNVVIWTFRICHQRLELNGARQLCCLLYIQKSAVALLGAKKNVGPGQNTEKN
jgi:hypothetical protein